MVNLKAVCFLIRLVMCVLIFATIILIAVANGACTNIGNQVKVSQQAQPGAFNQYFNNLNAQYGSCGQGSNYGFTISDWGQLDARIIGQYFILVFTALLLIERFATLLYPACIAERNPEADKLIAGCCGLLMLAMACVEAWYSAGFGWMNDKPNMQTTLKYVVSWAVATGIMFFTALLYFADAFLSNKTDLQDKTYKEDSRHDPQQKVRLVY